MSSKLITKSAVLTLFLLCGLWISQGLHPQAAQAGQGGEAQNGARPATEEGEAAIAYVGPSRESQQIRLINPDGSNDRSLWQAPAETTRQNGIGELSWRSDASELAFD